MRETLHDLCSQVIETKPRHDLDLASSRFPALNQFWLDGISSLRACSLVSFMHRITPTGGIRHQPCQADVQMIKALVERDNVSGEYSAYGAIKLKRQVS